MNKTVRKDIFLRSGGVCEAGCGRHVTEEIGRCDHFFGRAKAEESVRTCWFLCLACDNEKTANNPTSSYWLVRFIRHASTHGLVEQVDRALTRLEFLAVKRISA